MPIPTEPGTYQIKDGPIVALCHETIRGSVWLCMGSSVHWTPEAFVRIWDDREFERLVPETSQLRERTPVEVIREMGNGCPIWDNQTPIFTQDEARRSARRLLDAADYYDIRVGLREHIYEMKKFLSIEVPNTPRKGIVENAIRAAIDALIQDAGWSCAKEDLDAETERRYLEAR